MLKVILLDDENDLREEVGQYLCARGMEVTEVATISQFHQQFSAHPFDVLVIDRMLPDGDGLELVESLRQEGVRAGIVLFSSRDASKDRIEGYERGADHYLTKPVRLQELKAVIDAVGKRVREPRQWVLDMVNWSLLSPDGSTVQLTALEAAFLHGVATAPNRQASRTSLVRRLGRDAATYDFRNLDALVLRLRRKVGDGCTMTFPLKTLHGMGYCLTQSISINEPA